jgi:hypothetical protein
MKIFAKRAFLIALCLMMVLPLVACSNLPDGVYETANGDYQYYLIKLDDAQDRKTYFPHNQHELNVTVTLTVAIVDAQKTEMVRVYKGSDGSRIAIADFRDKIVLYFPADFPYDDIQNACLVYAKTKPATMTIEQAKEYIPSLAERG